MFQITGPCSRILQSTSADMTVAAQLIRQCSQKLKLIREDEHSWQSLVTEAQRFATAHDVDANFPVHRARRPPRQHDEKTEKKTVNVVLSIAQTAIVLVFTIQHWIRLLVKYRTVSMMTC